MGSWRRRDEELSKLGVPDDIRDELNEAIETLECIGDTFSDALAPWYRSDWSAPDGVTAKEARKETFDELAKALGQAAGATRKLLEYLDH